VNLLGTRLVKAIAAQDSPVLAACFTDDVQLRALIPGGLRERAGAAESASLIATWFADSTELNLVEWSVDDVEDRLHIWYRFAGIEEGQPYLVEQHLFCVVTDGKVARADLLCSGFRPRDA
jgi:ketosteroid isomerase-like protein